MNKKKFLILLLCFALLFTSVSAYGKSLNDINDSIDKKEELLEDGKDKENKLNKEINSISNRIAITEADIALIQAEVTSIHVNIAKVTDDLQKQKKKLDKGQDALNLRLRNIYKSGTMGFIDVLFSSTSVSELISNVEMVKMIYENDQDIVDTLTERYEKIEAKQKALKKLEEDLKAKQLVLDEKQTALTKDKNIVSARRNEVKISNAALEKQIDQLNAEADRLKDQIQNNMGGGDYQGGVMSWPVPGKYYVSSPFGYRIHPIFGYKKLHTGIDIPAPTGHSIIAANSGKVITSCYNSSYGNMIIIDHGGGIATLYAHNSSLLVSVGQHVKRGQVIARAGSTGNSTGSHLHFEVRVNGNYVDPRRYV